MIKYITGDIFQSTMQTLVNPVNTVSKESLYVFTRLTSLYRHDGL